MRKLSMMIVGVVFVAMVANAASAADLAGCDKPREIPLSKAIEGIATCLDVVAKLDTTVLRSVPPISAILWDPDRNRIDAYSTVEDALQTKGDDKNLELFVPTDPDFYTLLEVYHETHATFRERFSATWN